MYLINNIFVIFWLLDGVIIVDFFGYESFDLII